MYLDLLSQTKLIGKNLRLLRTISEKTIEEVALDTGQSVAQISLIERGKRKAQTSDLRRILSVYGYSLGLFLSDITDSIESINPNQEIMKSEHQFLLDGNFKDNEYKLIMLRSIRHRTDIQMMKLYIPPQKKTSNEFLTFHSEIRGYVFIGKLLIEFKNDEYRCNTGEEFLFDGNRPHILRNYGDEPMQSLLIMNPQAF